MGNPGSATGTVIQRIQLPHCFSLFVEKAAWKGVPFVYQTDAISKMTTNSIFYECYVTTIKPIKLCPFTDKCVVKNTFQHFCVSFSEAQHWVICHLDHNLSADTGWMRDMLLPSVHSLHTGWIRNVWLPIAHSLNTEWVCDFLLPRDYSPHKGWILASYFSMRIPRVKDWYHILLYILLDNFPQAECIQDVILPGYYFINFL